MGDIRVSKDTDVQRQLQERNQNKGENQGNGWLRRVVKSIGVAYLVTSAGLQGAESHPLLSESPAYAGSTNLTDRVPPPLPPSSERFRSIPARDFQSFLLQRSQRTSSRETSQPADNLSSSQQAQGIRLRKKVRLASSLDVRSGKMIPRGETSQSAMETLSRQLEQGENKRTESLKLSKEQIDSLQSFVGSPEKKETAWQDLKKMLKNKEVREGMKKLMQHDKAIAVIGEVMQNDKAMAGIRKLMQNDESIQSIKKLMQHEGFKDLARSELKDEAGVRRALLSLANGTFTDACVTWYRANDGWLRYQECCRDEVGTPHCDGNSKINWKHVGPLVGSLCGAAVLCCSCAICCCQKDEQSAKDCCNLGGDCLAEACQALATAVCCP
jgi:hypothetical protein